MKAWTTAAAALGLSIVASMTSAGTIEFNRNMVASSAKHSRRVGFRTFEVDPVALSLLAADGGDDEGEGGGHGEGHGQGEGQGQGEGHGEGQGGGGHGQGGGQGEGHGEGGGQDQGEGQGGGHGQGGEGEGQMIQCTETVTTTNSGPVTVVIAISKCLNDSSIDLINEWVDSLERSITSSMDADVAKEFTFDTTLIEGSCEARTERAKHGLDDLEAPAHVDLLSNAADSRLFEQVLPGEVSRISAFAKFGRVLSSADDLSLDIAGVISFSNNQKSSEYIMQLENRLHISQSFDFQLCQGGVSCQGFFENCLLLKEDIDLFMYNPFQIKRSWECDKITDAIPVVYHDSYGNRGCMCACPAGWEMQYEEAYGQHKCVPVEPETCDCSWSRHPFGFTHKNKEQLEQCLFTNIATSWKLPVPIPFPSDNYVADRRNNANDGDNGEVTGDDGPRVDVIVTRVYSTEYDRGDLEGEYKKNHGDESLPKQLPQSKQELRDLVGDVTSLVQTSVSVPEVKHYTWKEYQTSRLAKIDDIALTSYGRYEITVDAHDYTDKDASCVGCFAVVDKYRPKHTTTCPTHFCDNTTSICRGAESGTAELTKKNIKDAKALVDDFYNFPDLAKNDACSGDNRCDAKKFEIKNFLESKYTDKDFEDGRKCFTPEDVEKDFIAKMEAIENPLVGTSKCNQNDVPVQPNQCTRCCHHKVALKEWWTNYKCGNEYDVRSCSGDKDEKCEVSQCLVLFGDSVASVEATFKPEVVEETKKVIAGLKGVHGYQSVTQVHRALKCNSFGEDEDCTYEASIDDLLNIKATNKYGDADAKYVYWRYKVGTSEWNLLDSAPEKITFKTASSKIVLEAWTACGIVQKFYFYVHLHVHSMIEVCKYFDQMWYQTTTGRAEYTNNLCAYPGSDFGELTFNYMPNIGLKYDRNQLGMNVSGVTCQLKYPDRTAVEILNVQAQAPEFVEPEIIERFAIEMQNQAVTKAATDFKITCTFAYTKYDKSVVTQECVKDFAIEDCDGPTIDQPHDECEWDDCAGHKLGPYEACGGNVVRATETAAYMDTVEEAVCCEACGVPMTCESIMDVPGSSMEIKRCVPHPPAYGVYGDYGAYGDEPNDHGHGNHGNNGNGHMISLEFMAKTASNHPAAAAATALLAASAMVAVVALLVVRRRRARAEKEAVVEDAYYPLLY